MISKTYKITLTFKSNDDCKDVQEIKNAILSGEFQRDIADDNITNVKATFEEIK